MSTTTQPNGTAPMGLLDDITGSYDQYVADVFSIGKTTFEAKGVIPKKSGQWKNGYFGIDNFGVCCAAMCCKPCCVGKLRANFLSKSDFIPDCILSCLIGCPLQWVNRVAIRQKYDIQGSLLGDGLYTACCAPCAIAQEMAEVDDRNSKVVAEQPKQS